MTNLHLNIVNHVSQVEAGEAFPLIRPAMRPTASWKARALHEIKSIGQDFCASALSAVIFTSQMKFLEAVFSVDNSSKFLSEVKIFEQDYNEIKTNFSNIVQVKIAEIITEDKQILQKQISDAKIAMMKYLAVYGASVLTTAKYRSFATKKIGQISFSGVVATLLLTTGLTDNFFTTLGITTTVGVTSGILSRKLCL